MNENLKNDNFDFSPLFIESEGITEAEGLAAYKNITKELPFVYADLRIKFELLRYATLQLHIKNLLGTATDKDRQKTNNYFGIYAALFNREFKEFEITTYKTIENYKEVWEGLFSFELPEKLNLLLKEGFEVSHPLIIVYIAEREFGEHSGIILNDVFLREFIEKKTVVITDIDNYISPIEKMFFNNGDYDIFLRYRPELCDFSLSKKVGKKEDNGIAELYSTLFKMEKFAQIKINPQDDSLYKFLMYLENINDSKPSAK